jgi:uncharacterized protein YdhG (YjbR/CyaY superfamily)
MAGNTAKSVDAYIASQPEAARGKLEQVRAAIRRSLPEAEETISYGIPTYKMKGESVLFFAGWKKHYSLYPAGDRLLAALAEELAGYEIQKSTIRFPLADEVPVELIERIAKFKAEEAAGKERK